MNYGPHECEHNIKYKHSNPEGTAKATSTYKGSEVAIKYRGWSIFCLPYQWTCLGFPSENPTNKRNIFSLPLRVCC